MSSHAMNVQGRKQDLKKTRSGNNTNTNSRNNARPPNKTSPDGIYTNQRLVHTTTSLIGTVVQVQVKNGTIYEGVLRTFSSKMDIVLDVAHKVEEPWNGQSPMPSLERLNTVIFNLPDIVTMTAIGVDLNYATKDSFTDTAISGSQNGLVQDAPLKELEPWLAEGDDSHFMLDDGNSNGWAADEMFKRNEEKFNVKTLYDDSLEQYTTPLEVKDTKEYRQLERRAEQLAMEIEKSDSYRRQVALENDDMDEEDKYSAVVRPGESSGPQGNGKYVPPHLRNPRAARSAGRGSPQGTPPRSHNLHSRPQPSQRQQAPSPVDESRLNGEKEEKKQESSSENQMADPLRTHQPPTAVLKEESKAPVPLKSGRDTALVKELHEFKSNFKLSSDETNTKTAEEETSSLQPKKTEQDAVPTQQQVQQRVASPKSSPRMQAMTPSVEKTEDKPAVTPVIKSTLNPDAPAFNPSSKSLGPVASFQRTNPTPPRVAPSPVYNNFHGYQQPIYIMQQQSVQQHMQQVVQPQQAQPRMPAKKAIVSVRQPGFDASQAAHAAGTPIQMAPQPHQFVQYPPQQMMPSGMPYQFRMMPPSGPVYMQSPVQTGVNEQNNGQPPTVMMGPSGGNPGVPPISAHMQYNMGQPHHITPPQSQSGTPQAHPAPSPIQHQPPQQQQPPHPPPSGTPQQGMMYPNSTQPPLQPSPHTPASPQAGHPAPGPHQQAYSYGHPSQQPANAQNMSQPPQYIMMPHSHHQTMMQPSYQPHIQHNSYRGPSPQMAGQHIMTHSVPSSSAGMHPVQYMPHPQMQGPVPQVPQTYHTHPQQ